MVEDYADLLLKELEKIGPNKADIPLATAYFKKLWHVYIDIDSARATFDVEASAPTRQEAFRKALSYMRRQLSCAA